MLSPLSPLRAVLLLAVLPLYVHGVLTTMGRITDGTIVDGKPAMVYWSDTTTARTLTYLAANDALSRRGPSRCAKRGVSG